MQLEKESSTTLVVLTTSFVALFTGYILGIYTVRGYLVSPELHKEARANYDDPVDSDETDIDEDETVLDHAPNWANGEEADRKQGLRVAAAAAQDDEKDDKNKKAAGPTVQDTGEECKLVLVVRTDLGMTKGMFVDFLFFPTPFPPTGLFSFPYNQIKIRTRALHKRMNKTG